MHVGILQEFYLISGLKINVDKTKAIKFGATRDSGMDICDDLGLIWTKEFTSLGINYNIDEFDKITDLNIQPKILEMEKLIGLWKSRNLTLIGKITITKTLLLSKIIHILLSLPKPSEDTFRMMEEIFKKKLWEDKPPKFKTSTPENTTANGGLQFPDIRKIDTIMKASWIKRIYKSDDGWASTPTFYGLNKIYEYGNIFFQKKTMTIKNTFWKNVLQSIQMINENAAIRSIEHILSMPVWYNTKVME